MTGVKRPGPAELWKGARLTKALLSTLSRRAALASRGSPCLGAAAGEIPRAALK